MSPPTDLSSEYAMRAARGGRPPAVDGFIDPWSEGPLIRYMAHLRHQYSHIGISHPRSGAPIELDSIFVERRLGIEPGGGEAGLSVIDLLEQGQRVVVLGAPGSGRSTLLSWLIQAFTSPDTNDIVERLGRRIPIPVSVETLLLEGESRTIQAIVNQLRRQPFWYEGLDTRLPDLIRRGQVIFLVDGLEDLRGPAHAHDVLRDSILDGMWRFPSCSWVLTADPEEYLNDPLKEDLSQDGPLPASLANLPLAQNFEIPYWYLQPLDSIAVRRFSEGYQSLHHHSPTSLEKAAKDLRRAIARSLLSLDLSRSPSLLTLLAETHNRRGSLPAEDSELFTSLVESTASIISRIPGAEVFPTEVLCVWMEAMGREAEIARFAATENPGRHSPELYLSLTPPANLGSSLDRDWAAGLLRVLTLSRTGRDPGDAAARTLLDEALCLPGMLVGRGSDGLSFIRLDVQQVLAGRSIGRVLEEGSQGGDDSKEALELLRSWYRRPDSRPILIEVFRYLNAKPELTERLYKKLIGGRRRRTLGELDDLGPLTHALGHGLAGELPERVQKAIGEFCDDAIRRWVEERGRVPVWASDLSALKGLRDLKNLDISGCRQISNLEPLKSLRSLQRLDLHDCIGVTDLTALSRLVDLQWLDLRGCARLKTIAPLASLPNLQWLDLGGCVDVENLLPLDGMDQLQALAIHGCIKISDLQPLCSMRRLKALVISGCTGVTDLRPLKQLRPGGQVWVRGSGVTEIPEGLRWNVVGLRESESQVF